MDPGGSKFIIRRDVNFYEVHMVMKYKDLEAKELETMMKKNQFKVKIPTSETRNKEMTETPIFSTIERQPSMPRNY